MNNHFHYTWWCFLFQHPSAHNVHGSRFFSWEMTTRNAPVVCFMMSWLLQLSCAVYNCLTQMFIITAVYPHLTAFYFGLMYGSHLRSMWKEREDRKNSWHFLLANFSYDSTIIITMYFVPFPQGHPLDLGALDSSNLSEISLYYLCWWAVPESRMYTYTQPQ